MIRPTRTYLVGLLGGVPVALLPVFHEPLWMVWASYLAILFLAGGLDVLLAMSKRELDVAIDAPKMLHLGEPATLSLALTTPGWSRRTRVDVTVDAEGELEPVTPIDVRFDGEGRATGELALAPTRRGEVFIKTAYLRWAGPLGLFSRVVERDVSAEVAVVPNIVAVRRAAIRLASHNTFLNGTKQLKFIGDGTEFDALREYVPGFNIRDINWRASARHRKLLCRENRSERNHRVVLAVDTGHLMREPLEGVPKLDHAINAALMLGYLSLKMGDQVGMFGFDSEVRGYVEPAPGVKTLQRLLHQSSKFEYSTHETNFTLALSELAHRLRRRAVVVVLTDFTDPIGAELMVEHLGWLARRHLVIFVAIRDPALDEIVEERPGSLHDLNRAVVAGDMRREREIVITKLRRQGIFCIDGAPEKISIDLINRYLDVHRRELI